MRRGVGIAGLQKMKQDQKQLKEKGSELKQTQIEDIKRDLEMLKGQLSQFAVKYKKEIMSDPVFRDQFHQMCNNVGIDPLHSSKSVYNVILGDFYNELAVKVIEQCILHNQGGLTDMDTLLGNLNVENVSSGDVRRAIKTLKPFGNGFEIIQIGGRDFVQSVPREMQQDDRKVLDLASLNKGLLNKNLIKKALQWDEPRIELILARLLSEGILWLDQTDDYYAASLILKD
ncbi:hypothetical protein MIR68_006166 [Amoeboaphelidium protococcarum]|nr:hypothetical protein MIR68_006166 [Amoeboaphelidium protococcarum]